ncbi:MAG TPA: hypothetical protein VIE17_00035 [Methylophilaceae bacterium]|jgi:hypothetical protein
MKLIVGIILSGLFWQILAQAEGLDCEQLRYTTKLVECGTTVIQADIPLDEQKSLIARYPSAKILSGDLTNDGINDFALSIAEHKDDGPVNRVIVLKGKHGGGYEEFAESSEIEFGTEDIEIKNHSLYINIVRHDLQETYQFNYRKGHFVLIGLDEVAYTPGVTSYNYVETSTNFLTGDVIENTVEEKMPQTEKTKLSSGERILLNLEDFGH